MLTHGHQHMVSRLLLRGGQLRASKEIRGGGNPGGRKQITISVTPCSISLSVFASPPFLPSLWRSLLSRAPTAAGHAMAGKRRGREPRKTKYAPSGRPLSFLPSLTTLSLSSFAGFFVKRGEEYCGESIANGSAQMAFGGRLACLLPFCVFRARRLTFLKENAGDLPARISYLLAFSG